MPQPRRGGAADESRRRFLVWTGVAAAVGVVAAIGGTALRAASHTIEGVRSALKLPTAAVAAAPVPAGAELGIAGLAPVVTPNAQLLPDRHGARRARRSTRRRGACASTDSSRRRSSLTWDELLALPLEESWTTLACVSNPVGGDLIGNAKWLGYPVRELLARARPKSRRRHGAVALDRRVHGEHSPGGADRGRAQRDPRGRHERRAAAGGARLPGADGRAGALRVRVGDEVDHRARSHAVRSGDGVLDRPRLVGEGAGEAAVENRRSEAQPGAEPGRDGRSPGSPGSSTSASAKVEVQVDGGAWHEATLATRDLGRHLGAVVDPVDGRDRARTRSAAARPTSSARRRPRRTPGPSPTARRAGSS